MTNKNRVLQESYIMTIGNVTKDNESNFTIAVGKKFTDILDKFDAVGEIKRDIEYRKSHGFPLIYDVYTRKEDGSWEIKKVKMSK